MNEQKWSDMNDSSFEAALKESVSSVPSNIVTGKTTPWRKAMNRVLVGIALSSVTLNFLCLNYILPFIGMILSLLGFRSLRRENRWFFACFVTVILRFAFFIPQLVFNTTVFENNLFPATGMSVMTVIYMGTLFFEFVCFWRGLSATKKKVGLPPKAKGAVALLVWYAIICVLAAFNYNGIVVPIAMIVIYFFIIHSIFALSKELDEAGYSVRPATVRISDSIIVTALVSVTLIGCVCGYAFGGSYQMDWSEAEPTAQNETQKTKARLAELGFPEYVLGDLTENDIAACENAVEVIVDIDDYPFNDGRTVTEEKIIDGKSHIYHDTVFDEKELRLTGIGVRVSGERDGWIIFHHFLWTVDPGFYGTESLQLWPSQRDLSGSAVTESDVSGRVLFDKDGKTFTAPYYFLGSKSFVSDDLLFASQSRSDIFAAFSMPKEGENQRGYLTYFIEDIREERLVDSWMNYTHQQSFLQYPAMTAMEKRMSNSWNEAWPFKTVQDALQF